MLLARAGFEVRVAVDVADALSQGRAQTFDVLLSDVSLPDGTGYELMENLSKTQTVRGIAMSGHGMEEDRKRSHGAGFSEHLVKPIKIQDVIAAIHRVF